MRRRGQKPPEARKRKELAGLVRVTLHLGAPGALQEAWLEWTGAQNSPGFPAPRTTIVGSRVVSMRLRRLLLMHTQVLIGHRFALLWDVAQEVFAEAGPAIRDRDVLRMLAAPLREQLANGELHPPGAEQVFLQDALHLRLRGITADQVRRTGHPMAEPLAHALGLWHGVAAHAFDEVRLYEYAAAHLRDRVLGQRVALYGIVDAHQGQLELLDAVTRAAPVDIFVPLSATPYDRYVDRWVQRWEDRGAQIVRHGGSASPVVHGVVLERGAQMADGIRRALVEGQSRSSQCVEWAVVGRNPERVRDWGEDARRRGVPVRLDGASVANPTWGASWAAATPGAPLAEVLLWMGGLGETCSWRERQQVADAGWHINAWPVALRQRFEALAEARQRLLSLDRWTEVTEEIRWFSEVAGFALDASYEKWREEAALWDRLGFSPSPDGIAAWWEDKRQTAASPDGGTGVLVTDVLRFRGAYSPQLIVAEAAAGRFPGVSGREGFLDEELARLLKVPGPEQRAVEEGFLFHLMTQSAGELWLIRQEDDSWPTEVAVGPVIYAPPFAPPRSMGTPAAWAGEAAGEEAGEEAGEGEGEGNEGRGFGAYDGAFLPGTIPLPTAATLWETYGRCPLQYAFRQLGVRAVEEDRPDPSPRLTGLWAHAVLERAATGLTEGPLAAQVETFLNDAMATAPPPLNLSSDSVTAVARSLVADLTWFLMLRGEVKDVAAEVPFQIAGQEGVPEIRGRIDRLDRVAGSDGAPAVRVVDYKSGGLPPARVTPTTLQLAVYARAASDLTGLALDRVSAEYWGIRSTNKFQNHGLLPPLATRWTEAQGILRDMAQRIDAGHCYAYPTGGACRTCDYRPACPALVALDAKDKACAHPEFVGLWKNEETVDDA